MCEMCHGSQLDAEREERIPESGDDPGPIDPFGPIGAFDPEGLLGQARCQGLAEGTSDGMCDRPAIWIVTYNHVEKHICPAHRWAEAREKESDLAKLLDYTGFACAVLPIRERIRCEYSPASGLSRACAVPARWAVLMATQSLYCDKHVRERIPHSHFHP